MRNCLVVGGVFWGVLGLWLVLWWNLPFKPGIHLAMPRIKLANAQALATSTSFLRMVPTPTTAVTASPVFRISAPMTTTPSAPAPAVGTKFECSSHSFSHRPPAEATVLVQVWMCNNFVATRGRWAVQSWFSYLPKSMWAIMYSDVPHENPWMIRRDVPFAWPNEVASNIPKGIVDPTARAITQGRASFLYNIRRSVLFQLASAVCLPDFDWHLRLDDDTLIFPQQVLSVLGRYSTADAVVVGRLTCGPMCGGAGYAKSKGFLAKVAKNNITKLLSAEHLDEEDQWFWQIAMNLGARIEHANAFLSLGQMYEKSDYPCAATLHTLSKRNGPLNISQVQNLSCEAGV